jgi:predicted ABC-type ATPase
MSQYQESRLDSQEHARIFNETILPRSTVQSTTPQAHPRAIVLAGQPGAGKGNLADAAKLEFSNDIVKIDPDELRRFHPNIENLRATHPMTWSGLTQPDASQWASELRDAAVAGKRNIIIDTTLGNAYSAIQAIK